MLSKKELKQLDKILSKESFTSYFSKKEILDKNNNNKLFLRAFQDYLCINSTDRLADLIVLFFLKTKARNSQYSNLLIALGSDHFFYKRLNIIAIDGFSQLISADFFIYKEDHMKNITDCIAYAFTEEGSKNLEDLSTWQILYILGLQQNPTSSKYNITILNNKPPKMYFSSVSFNEINNPQHRGMLKFFDRAFIGKPIDSEFISRLSGLIDYANEQLSS